MTPPHLPSDFSSSFPEWPRGLKGRRAELATLEAMLTGGRITRLALVGGGGSGKSLLAAALGHRLRRRYPGGIYWLRIGGWDHRTLLQMMALRLGAPREPLVESVRAALAARPSTLWVLDNHENDRAMARLFDALDGLPATFVLTARRCLLSGVALFPILPPLIQSRRSPFPSVRALTGLLRWNPLALDICDALVTTGAATGPTLRDWLVGNDVQRVRVTAHEDDVVEVRLVVEWAWAKLAATARRMLMVLACSPGDHMDARSLFALADARGGDATRALGRLRDWRLIQEPAPGRFALHAVVRCALTSGSPRISPAATVPAERYFGHYVALLERHPERFAVEQSNVFAAMDHAQSASSLEKMLRVEALLDQQAAAAQ